MRLLSNLILLSFVLVVLLSSGSIALNAQQNYIAKFSANNYTSLSTSAIFDNGNSMVGIGTTNITGRLTMDTQYFAGTDIFRSDTDANFSAIRFRNSNNTSTHAQLGWNGDQLRIEGTNNINFVTGGTENRLNIVSNGFVGIGTASPAAQLDIQLSSSPASGISPTAFRVVNTITAGQTNNYPQNSVTSMYSGTTPQSYLYGLVNNVQNLGTGTVNNAYGVLASVQNNNASGTIGNAYAFLAQAPVRTGPITNSYAFYAEDANSMNYFAGKVGLGTTSPGYALDVAGDAKVVGVHFASDGSYQTTAWTGVLCGGDYAESVDVTGDRHQYGPGDVLQIDDQDPSKFVRVAGPYSTGVAGVFSTRPGALGRRQTTPKSADELPLAMIGIVPVKVTAENGPIHPRDLLVSSSRAGYAMKGTDRNRLVGAVIGKAMGSLDKGTGVIEVLVTLQ